MTAHPPASAAFGPPTECADMYKPRRFWWLGPEAASRLMWSTASVLLRIVLALMLTVVCVYWGVFIIAAFSGMATVQLAEDGAAAAARWATARA
jgi:hypothetical protein